jgi:hypothetical protein
MNTAQRANYYNQLKPRKNEDRIMKQYKELKTRGNEWCEVAIELKTRDGFKVLSITGSAGEVMSERQAKAYALDYWISFFEEMPEEIAILNGKAEKKIRSAKSAAQYVLSIDGAYRGLDVHQIKDGKVYITYSCGQIVEALKEWFPEYAHLLPYHLNDMKAGTPKQDAAIAHITPYNYDEACKHLESINLLHDYDPRTSLRCTYGHAWLKRELPADIVSFIMNL